MRPLQEHPIIALAFAGFGFAVMLIIIGQGKDRIIELSYSWDAIWWHGNGLIWEKS